MSASTKLALAVVLAGVLNAYIINTGMWVPPEECSFTHRMASR